VPHLLSHDRAGLGAIALQLPAPGRQVGPEPVEGLPAQAGALRLIEPAGVPAPAAAGQVGSAAKASAAKRAAALSRLYGCWQSQANWGRSAASAGRASPLRTFDSRASSWASRSASRTHVAEG
jgi:hypothetical protein